MCRSGPLPPLPSPPPEPPAPVLLPCGAAAAAHAAVCTGKTIAYCLAIKERCLILVSRLGLVIDCDNIRQCIQHLLLCLLRMHAPLRFPW